MLEQAWKDHQQAIHRYIRDKVASDQDAQDIASDVFEKLLRTSNQGKLPNKMAPWLFRVAHNAVVDHYRTQKPCDPLPENLAKEESSLLPPSHELAGCIQPFLNALPENYRTPLMLSELEGKKDKEVAELLGISLAATKSRLLRGRAKLKSSFERCCDIYRNSHGHITDYQPKSNDCGGCEK